MITFQDIISKHTYIRARQLIRPYRAVENGPLNDFTTQITLSTKKLVALRDDDTEETTEYWLASIVSIDQNKDQIVVHYWYTTQDTLEVAQFKRAYHSIGQREKIFSDPKLALRKGAKPWTGELSREALEATMVAKDIQLNQRGVLTVEARRKLQNLYPHCQHAVMKEKSLSSL